MTKPSWLTDPPPDGDDPTGMRALLGGLPEPGPMPDDLVARIQASLAAEQQARTGAQQGGLVIPISRAVRPKPRGRAVFGLVVGAAAAVSAFAVIADTALHRTDGGDSSIAAQFKPSALAFAGPADSSVQIHLSDADYSAATLGSRGSANLAATWTPPLPHNAEAAAAGPLATVRGLTDCLRAVSAKEVQDAPTVTKVAAELARYDSKPALVAAVGYTDGTKRVFALDRACTADSYRLLAPVAVLTP